MRANEAKATADEERARRVTLASNCHKIGFLQYFLRNFSCSSLFKNTTDKRI